MISPEHMKEPDGHNNNVVDKNVINFTKRGENEDHNKKN
jgi:hypothetical protein